MSDDCSAWTPRHGGGAVLTVGGVVVVEIEPMGQGWWVSVGGGDLVSGTLQEAKVRALEMLDAAGRQGGSRGAHAEVAHHAATSV